MQGIYLRKYGVEAKIDFVLYEVDGVDLRTDAADGGSDCTVMKDEGAEATCGNDFVDEGMGYSITLTATEMEAARIVVHIVDSATKVWLDDSLVIETYGNASAQHALDLDAAIDAAGTAAGLHTTTDAKIDATDALIGTAQADLDTITGTAGALIATDAQDLSGSLSVNTKTITPAAIANASFNSDVGSTAHGTNIIALAVRKILEELNLDHLLKVTTTVAADGDLEDYAVAGTIMAHLMATAADATAFKASTDSLQAIRDAAAGNLASILGTAVTETTPGRLAQNLSVLFDNADAASAKTQDDIGAPASGGGSPLVLGAGDVGDFKEEGVVHFFWNTIDRSGAAVAPSTAGTLRVYKDDGTGEVTAPTGITDTRAFDGVTGLQECKIDTSASSFYAKHKNYSVILVGAVIDTKTVNVKVGAFSIEDRWANVHFHYGGK